VTAAAYGVLGEFPLLSRPRTMKNPEVESP
jgi:hypothetical protein